VDAKNYNAVIIQYRFTTYVAEEVDESKGDSNEAADFDLDMYDQVQSVRITETQCLRSHDVPAVYVYFRLLQGKRGEVLEVYIQVA
jgi:hypothetical protein